MQVGDRVTLASDTGATTYRLEPGQHGTITELTPSGFIITVIFDGDPAAGNFERHVWPRSLRVLTAHERAQDESRRAAR